jgi:hypothetical protein
MPSSSGQFYSHYLIKEEIDTTDSAIQSLFEFRFLLPVLLNLALNQVLRMMF